MTKKKPGIENYTDYKIATQHKNGIKQAKTFESNEVFLQEKFITSHLISPNPTDYSESLWSLAELHQEPAFIWLTTRPFSVM